jgi:hypothetical protein
VRNQPITGIRRQYLLDNLAATVIME